MQGKTTVSTVRSDFPRLLNHGRSDVKPKAAVEMSGQCVSQTSGTAAEVKGIVTGEREPEPRTVTQQRVDRLCTTPQEGLPIPSSVPMATLRQDSPIRVKKGKVLP